MRSERLGLFALLLLCLPICAAAQQPWSGIIVTSRAADWTQAGAGTIPTNRTQGGSTIAAYAGSPSVIANAFSACPAGTYVQLGAGTFNLTGTIGLSNSNVTLRGMGPRSTLLNFSSQSSCTESGPAGICVQGGTNIDGSIPDNISHVSGYSQGSTTILLGTQTTGSHKPQVGDLIELNQQVDGTSTAADTWPQVFSCITSGLSSNNCTNAASGTADGTPASYGGPFQMVVVTSITGGTCTDASPCTVGISPSIRMPNWGVQPVRAWWSNSPSATGIGIENLQIADGSNIGFRFVDKSWIRNVESNANGRTNKAIILNHTALMTIRDSYIVGPNSWSSDNYAVDCYACGSTLFENNIIELSRGGFIQEMGEGNVLSYNYDLDNPSGNNPSAEEGLINNHGCCSSYVLLEGNDGVTVVWDNYYGQVSFGTLFRNRFYGNTSKDVSGGTGTLMAVELSALSRFPNIVGNVLGDPTHHTNYQCVGGDGNSFSFCNLSIYALGKGVAAGGTSSSDPDDLHLVPSAMRWGNWDAVTNAVRWCGNSSDPGWSTTCASTSEVPTGLADYANAVPSSTTLPASFLYFGQPSWWTVTGQAAIPWPPIGPDVTNGNLANSGGFANEIPARMCFEKVMGGTFGDTTPRNFDANACYGTLASGTPPNPPTGLTALVQ